MVIDCSKCPERGICCGLIPFSKEFYEKHKDKIKVKPIEVKEGEGIVVAATKNLRCVFQDPKTWLCAVYKDRPEMCRAFGTKEGINTKGLGLACTYFKPNGNPWSKAMQTRIARIKRKGAENLINKREKTRIEAI